MSLPSNKSLKLTTARYYTPSGRCIQKLPTYNEDAKIEGKEVQFNTANGRPVTSRHGIDPDTILSEYSNSQILNVLEEEQLLFRFVNEYCANIDTLSKDWKAGDKEFKKLQAWLLKQDDFSIPEPYALLENSDNIAHKNGYSIVFSNSMKKVLKGAKKDFLKGLSVFRPDILRKLTILLQTRYRTSKEMTSLLFTYDQLIVNSTIILSGKTYQKLLLPQ